MKGLLTLVLVVVLVGGGWYFIMNKSAAVPPEPGTGVETATTLASSTPVTASSTALMTATVMYGPDGFTPSVVTIAKGGTVTFISQSGSQMWVASNPHPTHEGYSGTTKDEHCPDTAGAAFDECTIADHYSFTFQKVGSWGYHNHLNHGATGTIVVQ